MGKLGGGASAPKPKMAPVELPPDDAPDDGFNIVDGMLAMINPPTFERDGDPRDLDPDAHDRRVYRFSSLGNCITALGAMAAGIERAEMPQSLQPALEMGTRMEPVVLQMLRDDGWQSVTFPELRKLRESGVVRGYDSKLQQVQVGIEVGSNVLIRGHLDDMMWHPENKKLYAVEVKVFGEALWKKWVGGRFEKLEGYAYQFSAQMASTGKPGLFVVALKSGNNDDDVIVDLDVVEFTEPPIPVSKIKAKVLKADGIAKKYLANPRGGLPECLDGLYPCPIYFMDDVCLRKGADVEVVTVEDAELGRLLREYFTARRDEKDAATVKKSAGAGIKKWHEANPEYDDVVIEITDDLAVNRFKYRWVERDMKEKTVKAYTMSFPDVKLIGDVEGDDDE